MQKVYTKKGDNGITSLLGKQRLFKNEIKIESYGSVDELNAHIGFIRDNIPYLYQLRQSPYTLEHSPVKMREDDNIKNFLLQIQKNLFTIGSWLALKEFSDGEKYGLKIIEETDVTRLETEIDEMSEFLKPLKNFILPGGHPLISSTHIARTVCRRAERNIVELSRKEIVDNILTKYMNRLSDYLFVLSRYFAQLLNVEEIKMINN